MDAKPSILNDVSFVYIFKQGVAHPLDESLSQPSALTNTSGVGTSRGGAGFDGGVLRIYLVLRGSRVSCEIVEALATGMKRPPSENAARKCGRREPKRRDMTSRKRVTS
jgi:hypothetical protein